MRTLAVIPARYGSTRFPGKPLVEIGGISMIRRVYEQAEKANIFADIIVATDDARIYDHVIQFGGHAMMTEPQHQSGTDRIGEVVNSISVSFDTVFNIQGDEPFIQPEQLQLLYGAFAQPHIQIATLVKKITNDSEIQNPNCVKVTFDHFGRALYFSRSAIPYARNTTAHYFRHIGLYAYRTETLQQLVRLKPTALEQAESLEQLRWLENGYAIHVLETQLETIGIDTPEDLKRVQ